MSANRVLFDHFSQFPMEEWRWQNFTPAELACNGTGKLMVDFHAMDCLQSLRDDLGQPIYLNSAYRSPEYNKQVKGAKRSQHMEGKAFDLSMINHDPHEFEDAARRAGFNAFGFYVKQNFMHIDTRERAAIWGERFDSTDYSQKKSAEAAARLEAEMTERRVAAMPKPRSGPRRRRLGFAPRF